MCSCELSLIEPLLCEPLAFAVRADAPAPAAAITPRGALHRAAYERRSRAGARTQPNWQPPGAPHLSHFAAPSASESPVDSTIRQGGDLSDSSRTLADRERLALRQQPHRPLRCATTSGSADQFVALMPLLTHAGGSLSYVHLGDSSASNAAGTNGKRTCCRARPRSSVDA